MRYPRQPECFCDHVGNTTEVELWTVQSTVDERWGASTVSLVLADVDLQGKPGQPETVACPAIFFRVGDYRFVIIKNGANR